MSTLTLTPRCCFGVRGDVCGGSVHLVEPVGVTGIGLGGDEPSALVFCGSYLSRLACMNVGAFTMETVPSQRLQTFVALAREDQKSGRFDAESARVACGLIGPLINALTPNRSMLAIALVGGTRVWLHSVSSLHYLRSLPLPAAAGGCQALSWTANEESVLILGDAPPYALALVAAGQSNGGTLLAVEPAVQPLLLLAPAHGSANLEAFQADAIETELFPALAPTPAVANWAPTGCTCSQALPGKAAVFGRGVLLFYSVDEVEADAAKAGAEATRTPCELRPQPHTDAFTAWLRAAAARTDATSALHFTAHCWLISDMSVAATAAGELLLFRCGAFVCELLSAAPHMAPDSECTPFRCTSDSCVSEAVPSGGWTSLAAFSRGFLAGGDDGRLAVYVFAQTRSSCEADDPVTLPQLVHLRNCRAVPPALWPTGVHLPAITWLSVAPSERVVALALGGSHLQVLDLIAATTGLSDDVAGASTVSSVAASPLFAPLGAGGHGPAPGAKPDATSSVACAVLSVDIAVLRPLAVTVGCDRTVRVWTCGGSAPALEAGRAFPASEAPLCAALHPSGFHVAVGFADHLRVYNVLYDTLRETRAHAAKGCRAVAWARGGHALAASSGAAILLFDANGAPGPVLRGHTGCVTALRWSVDDTSLVSAAADGAVYLWDVAAGRRLREALAKGLRWEGAVATRDASRAYAVGTKGSGDGGDESSVCKSALCEFDLATGALLQSLPLAGGAALRALVSTTGTSAQASAVLFVAAGGEIVSLSAPQRKPELSSGNTNGPLAAGGLANAHAHTRAHALTASLQSMHAHLTPACSAAVLGLALANDDSALLAAGGDGCVLVFDVRDEDGRPPDSALVAVGEPASADVAAGGGAGALERPCDLADRHAVIRELLAAADETAATREYTLRFRDVGLAERLAAIADAGARAVAAEECRRAAVVLAGTAAVKEVTMAAAAADIRRRGEAAKRARLAQEEISAAIVATEAAKANAASAATFETARVEAAVHAAAERAATDAADCARRLEAVRNARHSAEEAAAAEASSWAARFAQAKVDADAEIKGLRRNYAERLESENDATLRLRGEHVVMSRALAVHVKDMELAADEAAAAQSRLSAALATHANLDSQIAALRAVSAERDADIAKREMRIQELKLEHTVSTKRQRRLLWRHRVALLSPSAHL